MRGFKHLVKSMKENGTKIAIEDKINLMNMTPSAIIINVIYLVDGRTGAFYIISVNVFY